MDNISENNNNGCWNLSQVPKKIFFYWGAKRLSFLRYMSLYSFRYFNPDWEIFLYVPKAMNEVNLWGEEKQYENLNANIIDYMPYVDKLGVSIVEADFNEYGLDNSINEVHKSDFIRYFLLYNYGGIWADMDILFINPISQMDCNSLLNKEYNSFIYVGEQQGEVLGHAIGFLMSSQGSDYFKNVFNKAKEAYGIPVDFKSLNNPTLITGESAASNRQVVGPNKNLQRIRQRTFRTGRVARRNLYRSGRKYKNQTNYQCVGADLLNRNFHKGIIQARYKDIFYLSKQTVYPIDHMKHTLLYQEDGLSLINDTYTIGLHWYGGSVHVRHLIDLTNHQNYLASSNGGSLIRLLKKTFDNGVDIYG